MSFDYTALRDTADMLIEQFGKGAAMRRTINGGTDTRACTIVEIGFEDRERDGSIVREKDRRFLLAAGKGGALATPPDSEEDKLVIDGIEHRIVSAEPVRPASTAVVWTIHARR